MKILVVGAGGREHALVWKLSLSPKVSKIFATPGNAGTALEEKTVNIAIKPTDIKGLLEFALKNSIDLAVVGPEIPLSLGIVDVFTDAGVKIFGPSKAAARIESSKIFSKIIMDKAKVPTAVYKKFNNPNAAKEYLFSKGAPFVVKADGLAAGKGVFISRTVKEGLFAIDQILVEKIFGETDIIIEDFLQGEEVSFMVVTDGKNVVPLPQVQDHKQLFNNDRGPNTGGMGAYSPANLFTDEEYKNLAEVVITPILKEFEAMGTPYKGVLYAGLMISKKPNGAKIVNVLEYNCRFGDPETQVIMALFESDLVDLLTASIEGTLKDIRLKWGNLCALCVVMASGGYPEKYSVGFDIAGLGEVSKRKNIKILHSGTESFNGQARTAGGRVISVVGLGETLVQAQRTAYSAAKEIFFEDAYYRTDIGTRHG